jgi:hypothetical protein
MCRLVLAFAKSRMWTAGYAFQGFGTVKEVVAGAERVFEHNSLQSVSGIEHVKKHSQ